MLTSGMLLQTFLHSPYWLLCWFRSNLPLSCYRVAINDESCFIRLSRGNDSIYYLCFAFGDRDSRARWRSAPLTGPKRIILVYLVHRAGASMQKWTSRAEVIWCFQSAVSDHCHTHWSRKAWWQFISWKMRSASEWITSEAIIWSGVAYSKSRNQNKQK